MPWGDCTGPWWMGFGTNRVAGQINPWCRRGSGYGRGFGNRWGIGYGYESFRQPTPEDEIKYLESVARNLEDDLKSLRDQIEMLRSKA